MKYFLLIQTCNIYSTMQSYGQSYIQPAGFYNTMPNSQSYYGPDYLLSKSFLFKLFNYIFCKSSFLNLKYTLFLEME